MQRDGAQEVDAAVDALQLLALAAERRGFPRADGEDDRVELMTRAFYTKEELLSVYPDAIID